MILEDRYLIIKRADMERYLSPESAAILIRMASLVAGGRQRDRRAPMQGLVIERDWPEYQISLDLLESRVDGTTPMVMTYAQHEEKLSEILTERDHREGIIDQILDLVLGVDRPEWSSAYGFEDAVHEVSDRVATSYREQPKDPAPQIPEGMALVPQRIPVEGDAWKLAQASFGGPGTNSSFDPEEPFLDCTLYVGEIELDDGSKVHGLHVSCDECPEEGMITLSAFDPVKL